MRIERLVRHLRQRRAWARWPHGRRIPPLVMGHEAAGEVVECGIGVSDLHPGDRVTFDPRISEVAPLKEGPCWFDRLYRHEPGLMKVILRQ